MQNHRQSVVFYPEQAVVRSEKITGELAAALLTAVLSLSVTASACSLFNIYVDYLWLILVVVVVSLILSGICCLKGRALIAGGAVMALIPVVAYIAGMSMMKPGAALIANQIMAAVGQIARQINMPFEVNCSNGEEMLCVTFACCTAAVWVVMFCTYIIRENGRLAAALTLSVLGVLNIVMGTTASWAWFIGAWISMLTICCKSFADNNIGVSGSRFALSFAAMLFFIAVISAAAAGALSITTSQGEYERPQIFRNLSEKASDGIREVRYGEADSRTMPGGDFRKLADADFSDKVMLVITADEYDSLYLRGFIGTEYTAEGWKNTDGRILYDGADMFYWMHRDGLFGQNLISYVTRLLDKNAEENIIKMTVRTHGADRSIFYIPYETTSLKYHDSEMLNLQLLDDTSVSAPGWKGQSNYSFYTLRNQVKKYPSLVAELNKRMQEKEISVYINAESHYNEFVYETYTTLPASTETLLANHLKGFELKTAEGEKHPEYSSVKEAVLDFLNRELKYSEDIQEKSEEIDFMKDLLEISRSGYSVHYATAAALILRYYGIPARYVEGYLITPEAVKNSQPGQDMVIRDKDSHAWVEYYQDGIGWVPFEVTPPYMDVMEQPEALAASGSGGTSGQSEGAAMEMAKDNYEPEEPEKHEEGNKLAWKTVIVCIIMMIILVFATVATAHLIHRKKVLERLEEAFCSGDNNIAVLELFDYIIRLNGALEIKCQGSIFTAVSQTKEKLSDEYAKEYEIAAHILQKAAYSNKSVNEEERELVAGYKDKLIIAIKENCSRKRRFILKWIKCLY